MVGRIKGDGVVVVEVGDAAVGDGATVVEAGVMGVVVVDGEPDEGPREQYTRIRDDTVSFSVSINEFHGCSTVEHTRNVSSEWFLVLSLLHSLPENSASLKL